MPWRTGRLPPNSVSLKETSAPAEVLRWRSAQSNELQYFYYIIQLIGLIYALKSRGIFKQTYF